jgi:hypothetical protein
MTKHFAQIGVVLVVSAGCWGVWTLGGSLLAWMDLDDLDLIGRVVLVFAFLTACQAALERLPWSFGRTNHS